LAGGEGPIILAAGRLSREKGFHVLLEAAPSLFRDLPSAQVVVFGEGPERVRLERRAAALGVTDRFRLSGFRDDLDALLPWADVVTLPSLTEGLPNVALEAAAAGVPVVATAVGGTPEVVVNGQTGFLVPSGDSTALADRISAVVRHPNRARAFGAAARRRVEDHFSFEGQARAYQTVFGELASARTAARAAVTCTS
jgi:glycosyltransferase involved in cell wall biosynthesis